MKSLLLVLPVFAFISSCEKEKEKCENWTYNETQISTNASGCTTGPQFFADQKGDFCGEELKKIVKDSLIEYKKTTCFTAYREFIKRN